MRVACQRIAAAASAELIGHALDDLGFDVVRVQHQLRVWLSLRMSGQESAVCG